MPCDGMESESSVICSPSSNDILNSAFSISDEEGILAREDSDLIVEKIIKREKKGQQNTEESNKLFPIFYCKKEQKHETSPETAADLGNFNQGPDQFANVIETKQESPDNEPSVGAVRKKADRAKLKGVSCPCCNPYYDSLGLSPESKAAHINQVSRHRYKVPPPPTPEHYWDVDFPSDEECRRRGYENKTDKPYIRRKKKLASRKLWKSENKPEDNK